MVRTHPCQRIFDLSRSSFPDLHCPPRYTNGRQGNVQLLWWQGAPLRQFNVFGKPFQTKLKHALTTGSRPVDNEIQLSPPPVFFSCHSNMEIGLTCCTFLPPTFFPHCLPHRWSVFNKASLGGNNILKKISLLVLQESPP